MKRNLFLLFTAFSLLAAACADYKSQIDELQKDIDALEANLTSIETVTANLGALRNLLAVGQSGDPIVSVTPTADGFSFSFKNNGEIKVSNNTAGISVGEADGSYYWMLDGKPLKDASGANANIAVSPKFHSKDGKVEVSTDSGKTWTVLPSSTSAVITKVEEDASGITVTLLGGTQVVFPKESKMTVMISGDGSTLAGQGRVIVDYLIEGGSGQYTVATSQSKGWSPMLIEENSFKGQIVFVASGNPESDEVVVYVSDGSGQMIATKLNLSTLIPDEQFPVMYPVYDAYNIGCEGGSVDVAVNTNLEFDITIAPEAGQWLTMTGTKAVRQDKITFSAPANDATTMRSAAVTLSAGAYIKTVMVCQDGRMPSVGQNLSENGTANCYIVPGEGDYYFDATVIGNGQQGIIEGAGFHTDNASIVPADVDILYEFSTDVLIENLRLEDGKVYFHATGAKGNLSLCALDDDWNILWSWHLWFTDIPKEKTHTSEDGQQFTLMDRNLGATSADPADGEATYGLYYQWGRKDPFEYSTIYTWVKRSLTTTLAFVVQAPTLPLTTDLDHSFNWLSEFNYYLWGNPDTKTTKPLKELTKSIYDPCPVGYMVPPASVYVVFRDKSRLEFITNGFIFRGDYGQTSFYPYAGRVYQSSYDAFGYNQEEIYAAVWNSNSTTYNIGVYDGGACMSFRVKTINMAVNNGDFCARGIPVRCVKQQ